MVPDTGINHTVEDIAEAKKEAAQIGYPILVKASAGGGGKGMRVVEKESEFEQQMKRAVSEAKSAFGDGAVFIEKYISSPRHIKIQILGNTHGNILYLFERECSIQRRHQKVVEEAPSAVVDDKMRKAMGEAAVNVARACNYYGAGTVEFIVDENLNFYFLEMNTRLQVEHPITEQIIGIDLVKEQIKIAEGKAISFKQEDLKINGHSVEVRVYAEDPANNFLPNVGEVIKYQTPKGIGVRIDDGFEQGMEVLIFYDSMIAKLITFGKDREEAINRMIRAIDEYRISGIQTTLPFCKFVMQHEAFRSGNFDTKFVERYFKPEYLETETSKEEDEIAVAIVAQLLEKGKSNLVGGNINNSKENFNGMSDWRKKRRIF